MSPSLASGTPLVDVSGPGGHDSLSPRLAPSLLGGGVNPGLVASRAPAVRRQGTIRRTPKPRRSTAPNHIAISARAVPRDVAGSGIAVFVPAIRFPFPSSTGPPK